MQQMYGQPGGPGPRPLPQQQPPPRPPPPKPDPVQKYCQYPLPGRHSVVDIFYIFRIAPPRKKILQNKTVKGEFFLFLIFFTQQPNFWRREGG